MSAVDESAGELADPGGPADDAAQDEFGEVGDVAAAGPGVQDELDGQSAADVLAAVAAGDGVALDGSEILAPSVAVAAAVVDDAAVVECVRACRRVRLIGS